MPPRRSTPSAKGSKLGTAVFLIVLVLLGRGCWSISSDQGRMQDYCASGANTAVEMFGGDRSDWRAVYNECSSDPNEPWNRGR